MKRTSASDRSTTWAANAGSSVFELISAAFRSANEGRPWAAEVVREAAQVMRSEGTPMDDHRASAAYRSATLGTALLKLHAENATPQEVGA